jgi:hypothetical protein
LHQASAKNAYSRANHTRSFQGQGRAGGAHVLALLQQQCSHAVHDKRAQLAHLLLLLLLLLLLTPTYTINALHKNINNILVQHRRCRLQVEYGCCSSLKSVQLPPDTAGEKWSGV